MDHQRKSAHPGGIGDHVAADLVGGSAQWTGLVKRTPQAVQNVCSEPLEAKTESVDTKNP